MGYFPQLSESLPGFSAAAVDFKHTLIEVDSPELNEDMHIHDFCEIYVNVTGKGSFMVENRLYPVTHGDIILTRSNEMHHGVFGKEPHDHYCLWFHAGENAAWMTRFFERERGEGNLLSLSPADKEKLLYLLSQMERALSDNGDRRRATAAFLRILLLIENGDAETGDYTDLPEPLTLILDELRENYRETLHIGEIAERHFISQSTLNRLFHTYLRISPHVYLENLRLAEAKRMLTAGHDVTETALECGFSDCTHFILLFRKRFGVTPGKYRKNAAGAEAPNA